ncbi:AMP-binding protein [Pelagibius sp. Alg239-R121]|uniref:AMP-binding protein n=1 Tax=Pelagibius sp. Alg239-R121 TaxID=2993448 RepID=UPI0024A67E48|nr:AMP-binding protein [Pelagibius sp. Alg239-R121]
MSFEPKDPASFENVFAFFAATAAAVSERPCFNVLPETAEIYGIASGELSYGGLALEADAKFVAYREAGYGQGHRVGLLLENRPAFLVHWLALNRLGASIVPINPDLRAAELAYLVSHSEMDLAVVLKARQEDLKRAGADGGLAVIGPDANVPIVAEHAKQQTGGFDDEAALLYTSGTTGLPKGCVLNNSYFLNCGHWYRFVGGHCALNLDGERMITPLPLFHMNALACSTMAMIAVGGCLTVLDRFHPTSWWESVRSSKATVMHYLGVMPAMLMSAADSGEDRNHFLRFGFGAGVEERLHAPFEARFGVPLIEAWAMTETGNGAVVAASQDPRHIGTRCFGRPQNEIAVRIEGDDGKEAEFDVPGELLVRRKGENPRYGFFDRYLKDPEATAEAWRDNWFHTGDIVKRNEDGSLAFVDRKKNVIRRSGENIAAIEVEGVLLRHPEVAAVAVAATPDPVRGDEVFVCIVPAEGFQNARAQDLAENITRWSLEQLAYYKAPGYIAFVENLPLTSTNKVQRGELKTLVEDLRARENTLDLRHLKKRAVA